MKNKIKSLVWQIKLKKKIFNFVLNLVSHITSSCVYKGKGKGKAIPLQAWRGSEGSRRLRLPDFKKIGT